MRDMWERRLSGFLELWSFFPWRSCVKKKTFRKSFFELFMIFFHPLLKFPHISIFLLSLLFSFLKKRNFYFLFFSHFVQKVENYVPIVSFFSKKIMGKNQKNSFYLFIILSSVSQKIPSEKIFQMRVWIEEVSVKKVMC